MKRGKILPAEGRLWFIPWARYDKCFCRFDNGELYRLEFSNDPSLDISISNELGQRLAYLKYISGFKAWCLAECSIFAAQTDIEIARFTGGSYQSVGEHGGEAIPIHSHTRRFRTTYQSTYFTAITGPLDTSTVHIEILNEHETVPIVLMCFAQLGIPSGGS